jgi:photosystem II stability/assembly factor-like uncharacterized protein
MLSVGLVVWCAFFLNISPTRATWQIIFTMPNGNPFTACFFFNESVGFIAGPITDGVFKTTDGGQTWVNTPLPLHQDLLFPYNGACGITQILMTDPLNGWLTCEPPRPNPAIYPGLYKTTDGGASWNPVNLNEQFSDVYQTSHALIISCRNDFWPTASGYVSVNNGATFSRAIPITNGIDFVDDLHGIATGYKQQIWSRSVDGGMTWSSLAPTNDYESWSVYGVKGTSWFFTASEQYPVNIPSPIRHSSDLGATWTNGTFLPFRTTGHITGFGFTLFTQVGLEHAWPDSGIWRSKDSGKTWVAIGGPSNVEDTRFVVTGCRGEVMYVFDDFGNVWKTTDGGDGSLPQFKLQASVLNVDSIDVCSPRDTTVYIQDLGCDTILITSANAPAVPSLNILDPATNLPPSYPIVITPNDSGGLKLELNSSLTGPYQTKLFMEVERAGFITYDTVTILSALRFYNPLRLVANAIVDSTSLCSSANSTLSIANDSCFNVHLVSSQLKYGTSFALDTSYANDSIAAFSTKIFPIHFQPTQLGTIVDSLVLNLLVLGKQVRVSYPITGIGKPNDPKLVLADRLGNPLPSEINFDTITRCQDSTFTFTIQEQGCDSLFVSVEWLDSTMKSSPPANQFIWKKDLFQWLTPTDTPIVQGIESLPARAGSYTGYLRIRDSVKGSTGTLVSLIPFTVFVEPGTRTLSISDLVQNYDTILFCDQKDSLLPIVNLGCDTIHDSAISIAGSDFMIVNPPKTPFVINPHDTFYVTVRYLPVTSGPAADTLTVVTDADSARIREIPLAGYATPTDTITLSAVVSNLKVIPGKTTTLTIIPSSKYGGKGLSKMQIVLSYNGDIMVPFNIMGATTAMSGALPPNVGQELSITPKLRNLPITINGTNMTFDSATPILNLQFEIMLSDSLSTDFHVASVVLNDGNSNFNKCLLGATVDTGTIGLQFVCGDTDLYNFLRYGANWSIGEGIVPTGGNVYPNPVSEGSPVTIPFTALRAVTVKIEIMNETGSVVYSGTNSVSQAGAVTYTITDLEAASGAYNYRLYPIDGGTGVSTGSFVIIR